MKKFFNIFWFGVVSFLIVIACTKDVGLVTEVEFQFLEEHTGEGYVNQGLDTQLTIVPEDVLEGYTYSFSYEVLQGDGYLEDLEGNRIASGSDFTFSTLSTPLMFVGEQKGEHTIKLIAVDSYGFTEELNITYNLTDVPVVWSATSPISQIELGQGAPITLTLGNSPINSDVDYGAAFTLSSGAGTLTPVTVDGLQLGNDYTGITEGSYEFNFVPEEVGTIEVIFLLKDSNGQEFQTSVKFEVVSDVLVVSISLGEHNELDMQIGDTIECPVIFNPTNATDQGILWNSSAATIVSVDSEGTLNALAIGSATITATSASNPLATASVFVRVSQSAVDVSSIVVSQQDPNATGTIRQLEALVLPSNATNANVNWSSSDPTIATVDANGLLTGLQAGMVSITATSVSNPEISGSIDVNISGGPQPTGTDITAFALPVQNNENIDPINHLITVNVADGTGLNVAPATLEISAGASISPAIDQVQDFSNAVEYTVTAANGDEQSWTVNVTVGPSASKSIDSFMINGVAGTITGTVINLTLPSGTVLNALTPIITYTGNTISPNSGIVQNFNQPVLYTVTAEDNSQIQYTVNVSTASSSEKSIDSFVINGVAGTFSGTNISLVLPSGTDLSDLTPTISYTGSALSPDSGVSQNFNGTLLYTVTAQDNSQLQYAVNVSTAASSEKSIDSFNINGVAGTFSGTNISLVLPFGTDLLALSPIISFTGASLNPNSGTVQDFNAPVVYTVIADDSSQIQYSVNVTIAASPNKSIDSFVINGVAGTFSGTNISLVLPFGTNLSALNPTISYTGTSISPNSGVTQNFNGTVLYTVTAADTSQVQYAVNVTMAASSAKSIDSFFISGVEGTITGTIIDLEMPSGTILNALTPIITFTGASLNPNSGVSQNFNGPVFYTVTADDNSQLQYTVNVTTAASSAKSIDSFSIDGVTGAISGTSISLVMPAGTDLTTLTPTIAFTGASMNPSSGVTQNFSSSVLYTVIAEDTSQIQYTVSVTVPAISFDRNSGLYIAPAGSTVSIRLFSEILYGAGNVVFEAHTQSNRSGTSLLTPAMGYVWLVPNGDIISRRDNDSFIMPSNGRAYFYGRHNGEEITEITIQNNQGPTVNTYMNGTVPIQ